jgi:hypothetical protein
VKIGLIHYLAGAKDKFLPSESSHELTLYILAAYDVDSWQTIQWHICLYGKTINEGE